jgi:Haem-NO-binding
VLATGAVLEPFGEVVVPELIRLYARLIEPGRKILDLIENTERLIHSAVRPGNTGAKPPVLDCVRGIRNDIQIVYSSERQRCGIERDRQRRRPTLW